MRSLTFLLLMTLCCMEMLQTSIAQLTDQDRMSMELVIADLREKSRISQQKIGILKDDVIKLGKVRDKCEEDIKNSHQNDIGENNLMKDITICEENNESLRKVINGFVDGNNDGNDLKGVLQTIRDQVRECNEHGGLIEDPDYVCCDECEKSVTDLKNGFRHYKTQLANCRQEKQDHKMMKYFMSKEVINIKYQLPQLNDQLTVKELKVQNDAKLIAKTKRDVNKLSKEHRTLLRDHEYLKEYVQSFQENLEKCQAEKGPAVSTQEDSSATLQNQGEKITQMEAQCKELASDIDRRIANGRKVRDNIVICLIVIATGGATKMYLLSCNWWQHKKQKKSDHAKDKTKYA